MTANFQSANASNPQREENASRLHPLTRLDGLVAGLSFLAGLALYLRTLAPGVLWGDNAEFQTLASTLGITHAPGYPIYVLLGKLFTFLPVKSIAYRVNLLSAVFGAASLALVYLVGRMVVGWRLPALAAGIALSVNGMFWMNAVIAERYDGAAMLVAAEILLLLLWRQKRKWQTLFFAGLLGGLSLGIHTTVALMAPAILIYLALTARRRQDWLGAAGGAILGVLLFVGAFLLLDAINPPSSYYNSVVRPSLSVWGLTPAEFASPFMRMVFELKAQQFTPLMFHQTPGQTWESVKTYFTGVGWLEWALLSLGLVYLFIRRWREGLLIFFTWLAMAVFIFNYSILDINTFYVPTYVPLFLLGFGCGLGAIFDGLAWVASRVSFLSVKSGASIFPNAVGILLAAYCLYPLPSYLPAAVETGKLTLPDQPAFENEMKHLETQKMFGKIEANAIVLTHWDTLYLDYYVAHVEQGRTGINIIQLDPQVQAGVKNIADSLLAYIDANLGQRPIYVTFYAPDLVSDYKLSRVGFFTLYRLGRKVAP